MTVFTPESGLWFHEPQQKQVEKDRVTITTQPGTDLWQRTYYGFQNDNAPVLYQPVAEEYFSFSVRTDFASKTRFDQCGVAIYQNSENWLKASIEYEDAAIQRLGSVVTNNGYSDWATTDIPANVRTMCYRLSRRGCDFCIECSTDGGAFKQMRICHLAEGSGSVNLGIYACSPGQSSFDAVFTQMHLGPCLWQPHM